MRRACPSGGYRRSITLMVFLVAGVLASTVHAARAQSSNVSVALKGSLTTGSQLFPNPNSPDEFQRAQYISVHDILGYGAEVRYRFPESDIAIALSADYLQKTEQSNIRVSGRSIPEEDGYHVIPVELTGYFYIPFSGERFGVYIGGGAGTYFGKRLWRRANIETSLLRTKNGYGIHVLSGVSYRVSKFVSVTAELKFRDLQFESVNKFPQAQTRFGDTVISLPTQPQTSRVHTDGMIIQLGALFDL